YDKILRTFRNVRIEIVHKHAQRAFRLPALGIEPYATRRADDALIVHEFLLGARKSGTNVAGTRLAVRTSSFPFHQNAVSARSARLAVSGDQISGKKEVESRKKSLHARQ